MTQLRPAPLLIAAAAALATSVHADPEPTPVAEPSGPVTVEVNVCLVSQREGEVDPECRSMQSQLQDQLPVRFGTLKVQKHLQVSVQFGEPRGIALPTGSSVEFRPISIVYNQLHMQLEMPGVMNARLRMQSGRPVIFAGERYADGRLVIEVKPTFVTPRPAPSAPIIVDGPRRPTATPSADKVGSPTVR